VPLRKPPIRAERAGAVGGHRCPAKGQRLPVKMHATCSINVYFQNCKLFYHSYVPALSSNAYRSIQTTQPFVAVVAPACYARYTPMRRARHAARCNNICCEPMRRAAALFHARSLLRSPLVSFAPSVSPFSVFPHAPWKICCEAMRFSSSRSGVCAENASERRACDHHLSGVLTGILTWYSQGTHPRDDARQCI
jgi:hypothetical protein